MLILKLILKNLTYIKLLKTIEIKKIDYDGIDMLEKKN